jgi:hypothetical protein
VAGEPVRVWYAAYGSNCDAERLRCYLEGGVLAATGAAHGGSADPSPPQADAPWTFDRPLRFAGHSTAWGGATALLDDGPGRALGRAWLLSWRQLEDLCTQENGARRRPLTLAEAVAGAAVLPGRYGRLLHLGEQDGLPVVTVTAPRPAELATGAPSEAYLGCLARGLLAAHPLDADELAGWLLQAAGVADGWDRPSLAALIADVAAT